MFNFGIKYVIDYGAYMYAGFECGCEAYSDGMYPAHIDMYCDEHRKQYMDEETGCDYNCA